MASGRDGVLPTGHPHDRDRSQPIEITDDPVGRGLANGFITMAEDDMAGDLPDEPNESSATVHESLVRLALSIPETVVKAIAKAAKLSIDPRTVVRERATQNQNPSFVRRAKLVPVDALWTLHVEDEIVGAIVFEVQTGKDAEKLLNWPLQAATAAAEFSTEGVVAVDILSPEVRRWYQTRFVGKRGHKPAWIRAHHVDLILSTKEARRQPLETIWGAVHHAQSRTALDKRVAGIRAALVALSVLDQRNRVRYTELMIGVTPTPLYRRARREIEQSGELNTRQLRELTDLERRGHGFCLGRAEGRDEGLREGLEAGRQEGLEAGRQKGLDEGRRKGLEAGRREGLEAGRRIGLDEGRRVGLDEGRRVGLDEGRRVGLDEGRRVGLDQGLLAGLRLALFDIIELRDLAIDDHLRDRIAAQTDRRTLERWRTAVKRCPDGAALADVLR